MHSREAVANGGEITSSAPTKRCRILRVQTARLYTVEASRKRSEDYYASYLLVPAVSGGAAAAFRRNDHEMDLVQLSDAVKNNFRSTGLHFTHAPYVSFAHLLKPRIRTGEEFGVFVSRKTKFPGATFAVLLEVFGVAGPPLPNPDVQVHKTLAPEQKHTDVLFELFGRPQKCFTGTLSFRVSQSETQPPWFDSPSPRDAIHRPSFDQATLVAPDNGTEIPRPK